MKKELEQKFYDRFKFFRPETPVTKNLMSYGFCCGDGWYDIIWKLCEDIEKELEVAEPDVKENFDVFQVKEKFGTLRFYTDNSNDKINQLILEAEARTSVTCESCGKTGITKRNNGWIRTLCSECNRG